MSSRFSPNDRFIYQFVSAPHLKKREVGTRPFLSQSNYSTSFLMIIFSLLPLLRLFGCSFCLLFLDLQHLSCKCLSSFQGILTFPISKLSRITSTATEIPLLQAPCVYVGHHESQDVRQSQIHLRRNFEEVHSTDSAFHILPCHFAHYSARCYI